MWVSNRNPFGRPAKPGKKKAKKRSKSMHNALQGHSTLASLEALSKAETRERDVAAYEAMRAGRPLKPPPFRAEYAPRYPVKVGRG